MSDSTQNAEACRHELTQIRQYLQQCETRLHQGEVVDLSQLGAQIGALCDVIQNMPIAEVQPLVTELEDVMALLDKVEQSINQKLNNAGEA